jgi:hypothetical protein
MKIYLCDVNMGECILYSGRSRLLVVDCGAKFAHKGTCAGETACKALARGMDALQARSAFKEKALVITHLDTDHYNGVLCLPESERFARIYLPLYYYRKGENGACEPSGLFYRVAWARAFFYLTGHPGKLAGMQQLFFRLPQLTDGEKGKIQCVAQGDVILGAGTKFRVLWPHRQAELTRNEPLTERLRALLADALHRRGRDGELEQYRAVLEHYALRFLELYDFYADPPKADPNTPDAAAALVQERTRREDALREAFAQLEALPRLPLSRSEAGQSGYVTRELLREMDGCSVVFERPQKLLACGDATPDVLRYLSGKGLLDERYAAVKLPCHGVDSYFSPQLPAAQVGLISNNGDCEPDKKISDSYRQSNIETLCCTNASGRRCAIYNGGMTPQCAECHIWRGGADRCVTLPEGKKAKKPKVNK